MRGKFPDFRRRLLAWFDERARPLPWRTERSLYRTVVSELMLQQTQVDTVLPYFERWMHRLPDFDSLAAADEATVLKLWEGLGYYTRARNLLRLARSIVAEGIPDHPDKWRQRPGVGPYTAAAIASIAQGFPEPVIDGNVIRVICRLSADGQPVRSASEARTRLLPLASRLLDPARPGDFNEAMMELGATVCRKGRPACDQCPVAAHCRAFAAGHPADFPVIPRKPTSAREVARLLCIDSSAILLAFQPASSTRLAGLAELPELPCPPDGIHPLLTRSRGISSERLRESIFRLPPSHPAVRSLVQPPDNLPVPISRDNLPVPISSAQLRWVGLEELEQFSLSGPHRRWLRELLG